ncbi:hypothetical protein [Streptomyces sp. CA-106131]|uniref:hypothetical protein n=1 Tax=Streptomyces sp. CA-106131 TaxID=3240045 RepID=UPI003D8E8359
MGDLLFGRNQADAEAFGFAEPALAFGLGDAVLEVVADLDQPGRSVGLTIRTGQRTQASLN